MIDTSTLQVLAAGNKEAIAIAHAAGFDFIRCEGFVFGHVADEGYIDSCAGPLLRFRKTIGAENVQIYCDIKKKHRFIIILQNVWVSKLKTDFLKMFLIVRIRLQVTFPWQRQQKLPNFLWRMELL